MPILKGFALRPTTVSTRLIGLATFTTFTFMLYLYNGSTVSFEFPGIMPFKPKSHRSCSPAAWSDGEWRRKSSVAAQAPITKASDALALSGFEGCAADREFYWHLGSEHEEQRHRFPNVSSWEWAPSSSCNIQPLQRELLLKDLVEQGGWLLLGDSITEGHFFSLSCILYPHVRATPNYTENPYYDRAWEQNLYLHPDSPLISSLHLPPGFNISITPLVTFRRVDLLLERTELEAIYASTHSPPADFSLFSEEASWSLSPSFYMPIFLAPLPQANYHTLIVSTAGHWTTTLFAGLADSNLPGNGIDNVVKFFRAAIKQWALTVEGYLAADDTRGRQVIVRAYLPGHEGCHDAEVEAGGAWSEYKPFQFNWYNWAQIKDFNSVFQELVSSSRYPNIHYLPIDRPGLLRPDAHAPSDCLHILTGPGVMEGWTHYIWHYITHELSSRNR